MRSGFRKKGKRCTYRTCIGWCHEWIILVSQNARNRDCQNLKGIGCCYVIVSSSVGHCF